MKVKIDFVTNSSSTSYCMLGVQDLPNMCLVAEALGLAYDEEYSFVHVDYSDLYAAGYHNGHLSIGEVFIASDGNALYEAGVPIEHIVLGDPNITWAQMHMAAAKLLTEFLGVEVSADKVKLLYGEAGDG